MGTLERNIIHASGWQLFQHYMAEFKNFVSLRPRYENLSDWYMLQ